jgi:hypothetical protein
MPGMKAFYVIVLVSHWHGHPVQHVRPVGVMTEHQCHLKAHWIEMQHPYTEAFCRIGSDRR